MGLVDFLFEAFGEVGDALLEFVDGVLELLNFGLDVAEELGQQLGQPLNIQAGGFAPPPMPMYRAAAASIDAMAVSTPVEGGELEISASVTITYELIGG